MLCFDYKCFVYFVCDRDFLICYINWSKLGDDLNLNF